MRYGIDAPYPVDWHLSVTVPTREALANDTARLDLNDSVNQWIAVQEKFNRDPIIGKIGRRKSERY